MKPRTYKTYYWLFISLCFVFVFVFNSPIRNYIPIIWLFFGFGLNGILAFRTHKKLSSVLINKYESELIKFRIPYGRTFSGDQVDIFSLRSLQNSDKLNPETKGLLFQLKMFLSYTGLSIGFIIVLALLTILT